jgi:hypothetical protein
MPVAGVVVLGLLALGGWLAGWPPAVFSAARAPGPAQTPVARHVAVKPSETAFASPLASTNVSTSPSASINAKNYRLAWNLGGSTTTASYSEFTAGFGTTLKDTFTLISVSGDVVTGRLSALQANGTTQVYEGTYTVAGNFIKKFNIQQISS